MLPAEVMRQIRQMAGRLKGLPKMRMYHSSSLSGSRVGGSFHADSPSVAELPSNLVMKFANRELLNEPLNAGRGSLRNRQLAKTADAETAERLRKIRYDLVGF